MHASSTSLIRFTAIASAGGLCLASAAFGGVYAYTVGIHGGILLAGITVLFAVCLELLKPLAISGAFQAFTKIWNPVKGLCLLLLGLVAVAYSVTSELSLMSASRGDLAAERAQAGRSQTIAQTAYERAQQELSSLKPSRPLSEMTALVDFAKPVCRVLVTNGGRNTDCQKPGALVAELGWAKRRTELEAAMTASGDKVSNGPAIASADPGSANLSTYLAALGFSIKPDVISQWLALIPVIALEVGSALAGLLVGAVSGSVSSSVRAESPQIPSIPEPAPTEKDRIANQIVSHLKANGGTLRGSHRTLSKALGADRSTIGRALNSLAQSGLVALTASKAGTVLKLAA